MIQIFFANKLKFGTSFVASPCGSFGLNAMTKSSIINNSTSQMSNTAFGMNLSCMLRQRGNGIKLIKNSSFSTMALLEGF